MKISEFPEADSLTGLERVLLNQGGVTKTAEARALKGGSGTNIGWLNVRDFGAVGDGVTDDWAAIQAALDAQAAKGPGVVYIEPSGHPYMISRPLRIKSAGLRLTGGVMGDLTFPRPPSIENMWGTAGNFPTLHCLAAKADEAANWSLGPALVPGSGGSLMLSNATAHQEPYVNWCEGPVFLNGLSQFTAECFIQRTTANDGGIVASTGILFLEKQDTSFSIRVINNTLATILTTTTGDVHLNGTIPIPVGPVVHVEMAWDGATLRLFVDGVLDSQMSVTGTMIQKPHEFGCLGHIHATWAGGVIEFGIEGAIDSIRLSNVARHTAGFAKPTSKLEFDGQTLLLQNFDDDDNLFTRCMTHGFPGQSARPTWFPKYGPSINFIESLEIDHLMLIPNPTGQGIWARECPISSFHDLLINGGVIGFNSARNLFLSSFKRIHLIGGGRVGFLGGFANGVCSWEDIYVTSFNYGFFLADSSGTLTNFYLHGDSVIPLVLTFGNYDLRGIICSNEDVNPSFGQLAQLALVKNNYVSMSGGVFETIASPKPAVLIDGGNSAAFIGPTVNSHPNATELIHVKTPLKEQELRLIAPSRMDSFNIPWSLSPVVQL